MAVSSDNDLVPIDCAASVSQCIKLLHKERLPPQRVRTVAKILLGDATVKPRSLQRLACFASLKGAMGEHEIKDCIKDMLRDRALLLNQEHRLLLPTIGVLMPKTATHMSSARSGTGAAAGGRGRAHGAFTAEAPAERAGQRHRTPVVGSTGRVKSVHPLFLTTAKRAGKQQPVLGSEKDAWAMPEDGESASIQLSSEQQRVLAAVACRQNVFFTGSAGTGKSMLMKMIVKRLRRMYGQQATFVTASTGIAASHIGGTTVHSFAGIGLGKGSGQQLFRSMSKYAKARWKSTRALVIDEISMLDGDLLDALDVVAKMARNNSGPFGGVHLILCGDFFQLPPIGVSQGRKRFAFEARCWNSVVHANIILTQVFRQKGDHRFVEMLDTMRVGKLSQSAEALITSAGSKLATSTGIKPSVLYARNMDVDRLNSQELAKLRGEEVVYEASAWGKEPFLKALQRGCTAPKKLRLKVGAQVILLRNLRGNDRTDRSIQLCNGSRGQVIGFAKDEEEEDAEVVPVVEFETAGGTRVKRHIQRAEWTTEVGGSVMASVVQFPLGLAWALSVHKSQGMTISHLVVNLEGTFEYGQAYVALSRGVSLDHTCVRGFRAAHIKAHPKVAAFYAQLGASSSSSSSQGGSQGADHSAAASNTNSARDSQKRPRPAVGTDGSASGRWLSSRSGMGAHNGHSRPAAAARAPAPASVPAPAPGPASRRQQPWAGKRSGSSGRSNVSNNHGWSHNRGGGGGAGGGAGATSGHSHAPVASWRQVLRPSSGRGGDGSRPMKRPRNARQWQRSTPTATPTATAAHRGSSGGGGGGGGGYRGGSFGPPPSTSIQAPPPFTPSPAATRSVAMSHTPTRQPHSAHSNQQQRQQHSLKGSKAAEVASILAGLTSADLEF